MKKSFITGIIILLPLTITFVILSWLFSIFTEPFLHAVKHFLEYIFPVEFSQGVLTFIARILILICFTIFIFLLGLLAKLFLFKILISWTDSLLMKIPIFRTVYHTSKDLIKSIVSMDERKAFLYPVLVPFTFKSHVIGFLSGTIPEECQKKIKGKYLPIFIPTAPHPISGYLVFIPEEKVKKIDMTNEEALKFTISCGIITPETKEKK
jgi:uncharacterized membrane protein